jgi:hypothetical protein
VKKGRKAKNVKWMGNWVVSSGVRGIKIGIINK